MNQFVILSRTAVLSIAIGASSLAGAQSSTAAGLDPQSHARLAYLPASALDDNSRKIYEIFKTDDGKLNGPLAFAAYNSGVGLALLDLHNAAVGGTLDAHARELAILVACRATNYHLEWNAHLAAARRAGIDDNVINIVRTGAAPVGIDDKDAAIIGFGRQLYDDRKVDSATFAKVEKYWGQRGAMDMVAVMNTYAVSGYFAIAVDERAMPGEETLPSLK
ncbi:MAG: carboxymuconolactone decarboxylase family protein [Gammaproteobacteria bacterium]|nr:carboxymuconolactone decarboxylase family protein [Gammaproteobacteria bacterium]